MPAARQRSLSSFRDRAVKAMTGKCSVCGQLPLPNRLYDLEAVQLRHVNVQDQQVEATFFHEGQSLPAVARQPHAVTLSDEQLLQDLSAQLIVLGHEDVQCGHACTHGRRPEPAS